MSQKKIVVVEEVAQDEFDRWAEAMDLDLSESDMVDEDLEAFKKQKRRLIVAITRGSLKVNDNGEFVYTPTNPKTKFSDPITFHERSGATLMATDGKKKSQLARKTFAMMADLCGVDIKNFTTMVGNDIKVCEAIFALLMD